MLCGTGLLEPTGTPQSGESGKLIPMDRGVMVGESSVGPDRTLLVLCTAFRAKPDRHPNLTVKKIPKAVLSRCGWGKDDYSLRVENLPKAPLKKGQMDLGLDDGKASTPEGGASHGR